MDQFISDTGASLAAAAIVAAVVWLANMVRNYRLEAKLVDSIPTGGIGVLYDENLRPKKFTVQISNTSSATIRVRTFVIVTDSFPITLHPEHKVANSQNPLDNAIRLEKFPRRILVRGSIPDDEVAGSMLLPPLCLGFWQVSGDALGKREITVSHAFIVFEYPNLLGQTALVRIKVDGERFKLVKDRLEEVNNNLYRGVVDPVIASFRNPPGAGLIPPQVSG